VNLIFGAVIDENMRDQIRITVIATGFERQSGMGIRMPQKPAMVGRTAAPAARQPQPVQQQPQTQSPLRQPVPPQQQQPPVEQPQTPPAAPPPATPAPHTDTPAFTGNAYSSDDLDIPTFLRKR
jgi:cell division protein FtsZ